MNATDIWRILISKQEFKGRPQSVRRFIKSLGKESPQIIFERKWQAYLQNPTRCQRCQVPLIPKRRGDMNDFQKRKYCGRICANAVNNRRSKAATA